MVLSLIRSLRVHVSAADKRKTPRGDNFLERSSYVGIQGKLRPWQKDGLVRCAQVKAERETWQSLCVWDVDLDLREKQGE
jgi:hypothetical protein